MVTLSLKSTEDVCEAVLGYKSTGRRRRHGDTLFCSGAVAVASALAMTALATIVYRSTVVACLHYHAPRKPIEDYCDLSLICSTIVS